MNEFSLHFVAFNGWMGVIDVLEDGTFNMWSFFFRFSDMGNDYFDARPRRHRPRLGMDRETLTD